MGGEGGGGRVLSHSGKEEGVIRSRALTFGTLVEEGGGSEHENEVGHVMVASSDSSEPTFHGRDW